MSFGVGGSIVLATMAAGAFYQVGSTDSLAYFYGGLAGGVITLAALVDEIRSSSRELHYCRKYLEKTFGEDPCDPSSDVYKRIRRDIAPP